MLLLLPFLLWLRLLSVLLVVWDDNVVDDDDEDEHEDELEVVMVAEEKGRSAECVDSAGEDADDKVRVDDSDNIMSLPPVSGPCLSVSAWV